ncbi:MAG: threonine-phosphate decarboxylase CobD [Alphaproteobacteria bacterium]
MTDPILHGGGLRAAEARFGRPAEGWLDLSTGISPWPYPVPPLGADAWRRLPEPEAVRDLERIAAAAYGVTDPSAVVAVPGAQTAIQWLPRLRPTGRVGVLGFTYAEHAHCWRQAGHRVETVETPDGAADCDVLVVVNPNNPDGRVLSRGAVLDAAGALAARGGVTVVDEAFADAMPETGVADAAGRPGLCVLRSFGKMYGLAGLRLGFVLAPPDLADRLRAALGPWAVGGAAIAVGTAALADTAWRAERTDRLAAAAGRLDRLLDRAGLRVLGGTPLFRLADVPGGAERLHAHLARAGILTRAFPDRSNWLRFGIPGGRRAERRLAAALDAARGTSAIAG